MAADFDRELRQALEDAGCDYVRSGKGSHEIWYSPITALSISLKVPDATVFRSGRHFAAWLGITPREHSTAGRQRLGKITARQDQPGRR